MSDTWSSIQAHKKQLDSLRERLRRRRKDVTSQLGNCYLLTRRQTGPTLAATALPVAPPQPRKGPSGSAEVTPDPELEKKLLHHLSDLSLLPSCRRLRVHPLAIASVPNSQSHSKCGEPAAEIWPLRADRV
ncbi:hypothetical protein FKM82_025461 [Ascaphus truei]